MYTGYATFANSELVNDLRAYAYGLNNGFALECGPCPGLNAALGNPIYTDPKTDDAPWYDASRPESARVLGFIGISLDGFQAAPVERTVSPVIGDGALIGPLRLKHREIRFKVMILAMDDCAMVYAMEYLAAALRGRICGVTACSGDTLCMFSCCPDCSYDSKPLAAPGVREMRTLFDVALIDGPTEIERAYLSGRADDSCSVNSCTGGNPLFANVEFVLAAGKPWLYHQPLSSPASGWVDLVQGQNLPNFDPDAVYSKCVTSSPCATDPTCVRPALPPLPPLPRDPCFPVGPMNAKRTMLTIRPNEVPEWLESVPIVEFTTGSAPIRRVTVRFYSNPIGVDCSLQEPDACSACADINIPYLPPGANVIIDGRTRRASMECSGGTGRVALIGPQGGAFEWPVFACGTGWCVEILARSDMASDAQVRVRIAARSDAG